MSFSTEIFIFIFFPVVLLVYVLCIKNGARNIALGIASLLFYAWGGVQNCVLILLLIIVNYFWGIWVKDRKAILVLAVVSNIGVLGVFKYIDFICNNLNLLGVKITAPGIVQPLGISFVIFSLLSYIIDVYYGKVDAERDIFYLGLYTIMFPKVVSGPIVRYRDIVSELRVRSFHSKQLYSGLKRFMLGFAKKILLANQIAGIVDAAFSYEGGLHPVRGEGREGPDGL